MRTLATTLLGIICFGVFSSNDCEAQLFRGRFTQNTAARQPNVAPPIFVKPAGHVGTYVPQDRSGPTVFPADSYYADSRNPVISRILDGKMTRKYRDPVEVDSRYIGGFHQSHFQNLGIPSGDIGLRGNAYNWRTW
ncbi:hypothetical protein [Mariniblastus fucicola]|uniref:Uncharacterized protein n=1 Tax=Mariniblastus fucicola TaxID=980251 RepID=A0A5B9PKV9_9BACT|nr:hypothetical protein [Mariniblastus fucicola]QEG23301.1 hypothetical protein MFFC18_31970 [Mariniblastus fucicola]